MEGERISYNDREAMHDMVARAPERVFEITQGNLERAAFPNADCYSCVRKRERAFSVATGLSANSQEGKIAIALSMLPFGDIACFGCTLSGVTTDSINGIVGADGDATYYSTLGAGDYDDSETVDWRPIGACMRLKPIQAVQYRGGRIAALSCPTVKDVATIMTINGLNTQPACYNGSVEDGCHVVVPHVPRHMSFPGIAMSSNYNFVETVPISTPYMASTVTFTPFEWTWDPDIFHYWWAGETSQYLRRALSGFGNLCFPTPRATGTGNMQYVIGETLVPIAAVVVDGLANDAGLLSGQVAMELVVFRVDEYRVGGTLISQSPTTFVQHPVPAASRAEQIVVSTAGEALLGVASEFVQDNWRTMASAALSGLGTAANLAGDMGVPVVGAVGRGLSALSNLF